MNLSQRIPVNVLTGFLGSGKTTLLKHWLQSPELANTAVIINELGAVGLDHLLVDNAQESMFLLENGCLCCAVRDDLITSLQDLHRRQQNGEIPAFDRVVIETTGLADPLPVLQTLMMADGVAHHYKADAIITCVDGVNGLQTLASQPEASRQVEVADLLLITKQDLAEAQQDDVKQPLLQQLQALNPYAVQTGVSLGQLDASALLESRVVMTRDDFENQNAPAGHSGRVNSLVLLTDDAVCEFELQNWLDVASAVYQGQLLRVKGLVKIQNNPDRPVLLHAVQQLVSPMERLPAWPSKDQRSRIVLIGEKLEESDIRRVFETFTGAKLIDTKANPLAGLGLGSIKPI